MTTFQKVKIILDKDQSDRSKLIK